jgi:tRNA pseudouridine13 synthase
MDGRVPAAWVAAALDPPRALGEPPARGRLRAAPGDFRVDEVLGFAADGGEAHVLLVVEKTGRDTLSVARDLARLAGVPPRDVGFAGLKDRHAVTRQSFTVPRSAARPAAGWREATGDGWRVLEAAPHSRKLRRGALAGNRFRLVIRDVEGDRDALEARFAALAARGVPNYFGPQRFGRGGSNLERIQSWLDGGTTGPGREQRAFVYSAARAVAFNAVLAARVTDGSWDRLLDGELVNLDGSRSWFRAPAADATLVARAAAQDVHPTGPLPGLGEDAPEGTALARERAVLSGFGALEAGLAGARVERARRALRMRLAAPELAWDDGALVLGFGLPAGSFATAVVRELVETDPSQTAAEEDDDA